MEAKEKTIIDNLKDALDFASKFPEDFFYCIKARRYDVSFQGELSPGKEELVFGALGTRSKKTINKSNGFVEFTLDKFRITLT
jgi:hypothetical protein